MSSSPNVGAGVMRRIVFILLLGVSLGLSLEIATATEKIVLKVPPYTQVEVEGIPIRSDFAKGIHRLSLPTKINFPLTITIKGPVGGKVVKELDSLDQLRSLSFKSGVIKDPNTHPVTLEFLPKLCPRVRIAETGDPMARVIPIASLQQKLPSEEPPSLNFIYDGGTDSLNHIPFFQLLDPDARKKKQPLTYTRIDGTNVLLIERVQIKNDYEDSRIVDFLGRDPITGKEKVLMEGLGGFYANFHYAVFPYSEELKNLDSQTLLHLAQGSLDKINRQELRPEMRTHSFLPGPFFSKRTFLYDQCEWGDTTFQAPVQTLHYQDLAIWDWDYPVGKNSDHLLMVLWEGDEEATYPAKDELSPHYLVDDLIGVLEIKREDTNQPLTLRNESGDFEITLRTGNMKVRHHLPFPYSLGPGKQTQK